MISKLFVVLCCLLGVVLAVEKYSDKYDNVDYKMILENERLLLGYSDCLLDKGKCTAEGKAIKENIQEALENGCERCTDRQKQGIKDVISYVIKHYPALWKEITDKYDPEGIWRKKYENFAKEEGIAIP
ncbi:allergen Tha p 1-like [Pararge aegeria]|nr:allergen Tha p 1-like [Pararge aegeria]